MTTKDLEYTSLKPLIAAFEEKGRGESAAFLGWFLENVYRLDDVAADDAICDRPNDKGVDAIYVDHNTEEIHILQSKIVQSVEKTIGDVGPKNLLGSLAQFETEESVATILNGNANPELKAALSRLEISGLIEKGYRVLGIYVANQDSDPNTTELLKHASNLRVY